MVYGSIVSFIDRLSVKSVLTNHTGSYLGFLGTLAYLAIVIILITPPIYLYHQGTYYQSEFVVDKDPENEYSTGKEIIMAMRFRDKLTKNIANHTEILTNLKATGISYSYTNTYKIPLQLCKPELFKTAINPQEIQDCLMLPSGLLHQTSFIKSTIGVLQMILQMKCQDVFKCNPTTSYFNNASIYFTNLTRDYYYEYIFNSKVLTEEGYLTNQFHTIYSTQYNSPDRLAIWLRIQMAQKRSYIDNSIMPWWNNQTYQNINWAGVATGKDVSNSVAITNGILVDYYVSRQFRIAYRYYKKIDFIIGIVGGVLFLLYLIFWVPFSYINRTLQKFRNAEQLFLNKDQIIVTDQNLKKIEIPFIQTLLRFLPSSKYKSLINQAEQQIDIVRILKKTKVGLRNLRTKGLDTTFKSRDIDLVTQQPQYQEVTDQVPQRLGLNREAYLALKNSQNSQIIFENNPTVLAIIQSKKLDEVMVDEPYERNRQHKRSLKQSILNCLTQCIKFFDVFAAKPMFNAQSQNSSCWGFFLTIVICVLSALTFALTIYNMRNTMVMTDFRTQDPAHHNTEIITGDDLQLAFCFATSALPYITGASPTVKLTFFTNSTQHGYSELNYQQMVVGQLITYFQLDSGDSVGNKMSQNCFRPTDGQKAWLGGTYNSPNQAYFGVRLDPFCSGTPDACALRKNKTISDFVSFMSGFIYSFCISENVYSPQQNKLKLGFTCQQVSKSVTKINGNLSRTQTLYLPSIQLVDDRSYAFVRKPPQILQRTYTYSDYGDRDVIRRGVPNVDPAYVLEFRPNGKVQSIVLRTFKIDFLLGIIGGAFVFWYVLVHFFAKFYNAFGIRSKLAQVLHQQDTSQRSFLIHLLYLTKLLRLFCCSQTKQTFDRMKKVDQKMQRDLNYLNMVKYVDNCYRLSSSLFDNVVQKDLSLIYFRQKIDESEIVVPRVTFKEVHQFQDDDFLELDDDLQIVNPNNVSLNATANIAAQQSNAKINNTHFHDIQKMIGINNSTKLQALYDRIMERKPQSALKRLIKSLDIFKTPAQLTLQGQRDIKSICGSIMFIILLILILLVCVLFVQIYTSGSDYTLSHRKLIDGNLDQLDYNIGETHQGIQLTTGNNFKFAVSFNTKDNYYPFDVSAFVGVSIGIKLMRYTIQRIDGNITTTYDSFDFTPCPQNYAEGFISPYNDPLKFRNMTNNWCIPNGVELSLRGTPQDRQTNYFKVRIYNIYDNATGSTLIKTFFSSYIVSYYTSMPIMNQKTLSFDYQMTMFTIITEYNTSPYESNMTLSKMIFTDQYSQKSMETYLDKTKRSQERLDVNTLMNYTDRNITFFYDGNIDHYVLDYPTKAQLFGIVGGVIALFTFIIYSCVTSFNTYRMKYLIGQRLYTFHKTFSSFNKGNKKKPKQINKAKLEEKMKEINNFTEYELLFAWFISPLGYMRNNYNFNSTLRRITLIMNKVQKDLNLYQFYQRLSTLKSVLSKKMTLTNPQDPQKQISITSIYPKHIYHQQRVSTHVPGISKQSKKHKLSPYQELKIDKAIRAKINPQVLLADKVLNRAFGMDQGSIHANQEVHSFIEEQGINQNGYFSRPDFQTTNELETNVQQIKTRAQMGQPDSTTKFEIIQNQEHQHQLIENSEISDFAENKVPIQAFQIQDAQ